MVSGGLKEIDAYYRTMKQLPHLIQSLLMIKWAQRALATTVLAAR